MKDTMNPMLLATVIQSVRVASPSVSGVLMDFITPTRHSAGAFSVPSSSVRRHSCSEQSAEGPTRWGLGEGPEDHPAVHLVHLLWSPRIGNLRARLPA